MTSPLAPLIAYRQWIVVKLVPLPTGKTDKLPVDYRTGQVTPKGTGGAHNPAIWLDYAAARALAASVPGHTVGFVITEADPFWCLDIDNALQPGNTWSPIAQTMCAALPNTVVEVSQSGTGLHVWGQGVVPPHGKKRVDLGLELYSALRFIAIGTGQVGDMTQPCPTIAQVAAAYFPVSAGATTETPDTGPDPEWRGPTDDDELIRRAMASRSAASTFGGTDRATFADLWTADAAVLARAYPSSTGDAYDRSSADAALAQHLAFWTGRDVARIERLMRRSALAREKWDRDDYLVDRTIRDGACARQREVLQDRPAPAGPFADVGAADAPAAPAVPDCPPVPPEAPGLAPAAVSTTAAMTQRDSTTFLDPAAQAQLFKGCVYIADQHRVMCPGGRIYKPDQFRATYGGYSFTMDARNERVSRNAFEAFTESQVLRPPIVDGTSFRPDQPYGTIVESEGRRRANVYWPANVRRVAGDVTPFLDHLRRVLPNPQDQRVLLYYMAGCVQFAGHKFQWFPLLIGVEGNGKSLFSRCVAHAIGLRYTHWPAADKLGKQFNGWLYGKLFYAIEDLFVGDATEVWEKLKPMVTGEFIEVEAKGIDQRTDEIVGNFMANSNHKGAVKATANDRRVAHLWCAQQSKADLAACGMTDAYHRSLYDWLRDGDGFAIVAEYLHTLQIPAEFGLNWLKGRAPRTSSTDDAIAASRGAVEQEITEAIERGEIGFRGGWISSGALDGLLHRVGRERSIPLNRRRELLQGMGYDWHPALPDGRVHNVVLPDGAKVKLFIRAEHPSTSITSPAAVAAAYSAAQGIVG